MSTTVTHAPAERDSRPIPHAATHGRMVVERQDDAVVPVFVAAAATRTERYERLHLSARDAADLQHCLDDIGDVALLARVETLESKVHDLEEALLALAADFASYRERCQMREDAKKRAARAGGVR